MLYVTAVIFVFLIVFAGIPTAINSANIEHIKAGRPPNAGVAPALDLITLSVIWVGMTYGITAYLGLIAAWVAMPLISISLLLITLRTATVSNRNYKEFLAQQDESSNS